MMAITLEQLTAFLGWSSLINIGILLISTFFVVWRRDFAVNIHSSMFDLDSQAVPAMYFDYLGRYKLMLLVFNIVPYLALRIIA
jgi:hypothetical protein